VVSADSRTAPFLVDKSARFRFHAPWFQGVIRDFGTQHIVDFLLKTTICRLIQSIQEEERGESRKEGKEGRAWPVIHLTVEGKKYRFPDVS